jgi:branched-chain amino acid transport system permease protein
MAIASSATPQPAAAEALEDLPGRKVDAVPVLIIAAFSLLALPLIGSFPTWVTLTVAGFAIGMMLFIMASGLSLVFGLMDVMNLGHAAFVAVARTPPRP